MALTMNGWRIGVAAHQERLETQEYVDSLRGYVHPRDQKLDQLCALMGDKEYQAWYERNRFTSPVARWEKLIDDAIAQYSEVQLIKGRESCPEACPLTASAITSGGG